MQVIKSLMMMLGLGVFLLSTPLAAKADEWNKKTTITFNQPVEIPGMVLAPGTYVFELMDSPSDRNVVQIFNADQSHLYENVLAIPAYRLESFDKTVVTFEERAKGTPEAIKTWFYPGDNYGQEFVYPKTNSTEVAALSTEKPPIAPTQPTSVPPAPAQDSNKLSVSTEHHAVTTPTPESSPAQIAQAAAPSKASASSPSKEAREQTTQDATKELPKTAGPVPTLILFGLLSLTASAGVHVFSKRSI
jgi:hypothetical protein